MQRSYLLEKLKKRGVDDRLSVVAADDKKGRPLDAVHRAEPQPFAIRVTLVCNHNAIDAGSQTTFPQPSFDLRAFATR